MVYYMLMSTHVWLFIHSALSWAAVNLGLLRRLLEGLCPQISTCVMTRRKKMMRLVTLILFMMTFMRVKWAWQYPNPFPLCTMINFCQSSGHLRKTCMCRKSDWALSVGPGTERFRASGLSGTGENQQLQKILRYSLIKSCTFYCYYFNSYIFLGLM